MITWENSRHFETPVLFSPPKDVCETSTESHSDDMSLPRPWVLLLFGWEFAFTNQKHYPGWGSDARERRVISIEVHRISALVPQMSIRGETSGNFGKWWLFFFRLFNVKKKILILNLSMWICVIVSNRQKSKFGMKQTNSASVFASEVTECRRTCSSVNNGLTYC